MPPVQYCSLSAGGLCSQDNWGPNARWRTYPAHVSDEGCSGHARGTRPAPGCAEDHQYDEAQAEGSPPAILDGSADRLPHARREPHSVHVQDDALLGRVTNRNCC